MSGKQIHLAQVVGSTEFDPIAYRVKKLVNSAQYRIGETLTSLAVKELCGLPTWTVTITETAP